MAGRNMYEDAYYNHQQGFTLNPFRWGGVGPASQEEAFQRNQTRSNELTADAQQQLIAAEGRGDSATADRLRQQLMSGNVEGGGGRHLLAPWTWGRGPSAAYHQRAALGAQNALQGQYDRIMGRTNAQPGDAARYQDLQRQLRQPGLLPHQARLLQQQANLLQQRLEAPEGTEGSDAEAMRRRMEQAGMRVNRPRISPHTYRQQYLGGGRPDIVPYDYSRSPRGMDWGIYATTLPGGMDPNVPMW